MNHRSQQLYSQRITTLVFFKMFLFLHHQLNINPQVYFVSPGSGLGGERVQVQGQSSGLWSGIGSDLHFGEAERVLPARPARPLHTVSVGGVASSQVLPVQVGGVTVTVPPRPLVVRCTVVLRLVLVPVFGGEPHSRMLQEGVTWRGQRSSVGSVVQCAEQCVVLH